jgi:hypothetical protein
MGAEYFRNKLHKINGTKGFSKAGKQLSLSIPTGWFCQRQDFVIWISFEARCFYHDGASTDECEEESSPEISRTRRNQENLGQVLSSTC